MKSLLAWSIRIKFFMREIIKLLSFATFNIDFFQGCSRLNLYSLRVCQIFQGKIIFFIKLIKMTTSLKQFQNANRDLFFLTRKLTNRCKQLQINQFIENTFDPRFQKLVYQKTIQLCALVIQQQQVDKLVLQKTDKLMSRKLANSQRSSKSTSHLFPTNIQRQSFFQSYFKAQAKRFSKNILTNALPKQQKKIFIKIFALFMQSEANKKREQDIEAIAKVLQEQSVFHQFNNDIKVIRKLSYFLEIVKVQKGQYLFTPHSKDDKMYKIIKGTIRIKIQQNSTEFLQKQKGHFIEQITNFSSIKNHYAFCTQQCFLLSIDHCNYQSVMNYYLKNKVILKMLRQTPLLKVFTKKQIQYIFQHSQQQTLVYKQMFFQQQQAKIPLIYVIIEGEVAVLMKNKRADTIICTISDGSLFGQQFVILREPNALYSTQVVSQTCRVLSIPETTFFDVLKASNRTLQSFIAKYRYDQLVKDRISHYKNYIKASNSIKLSFHDFRLPLVSTTKNQKIQNMAKISQEVEFKVGCLSQILQKRSIYSKDDEKTKFDLQSPFFSRQDFPEMQGALKRFANEQKRAGQKFMLPKIRG